jgi:NifB/MoaA-like Fe-S oxidoreductase
VRELAELWPAVQSISVVPAGLTRHHKYSMRVHTAEEAAATLAYVESLQPQVPGQIRRTLRLSHGRMVSGGRPRSTALEAYDGQQLQENGLGQVRGFLDEWENVKEEIDNCQLSIVNCQLILVTGTLFAPVLAEKAAEFAEMIGVNVTVLPVVNKRLGETITVAGLLMGLDVLEALAELVEAPAAEPVEAPVAEPVEAPPAKPTETLIILPRVMFDHPDTISLDDISPQDIANRLQTPIALADTLGDVFDALTGQSQVMYLPETEGERPSSITLRLLHDDDLAGNAHAA